MVFLINRAKYYPLVAQSVEQLPFKEMVVGSIPTERTREENSNCFGFSDTCARRSYVESADETSESRSWNFRVGNEKISGTTRQKRFDENYEEACSLT